MGRIRRFSTALAVWLWLAAALASVGLAVPVQGGADDDESPVRVVPIASAPSVVPPVPPAFGPGDERTRGIADALRGRASRQRLRRAASRPVALDARQSASLAGLRQRTGDAVRVRMRRETGTPRQIIGRSLESAASAVAPGADRELETARSFLRRTRGLLRLEDPDRELALRRRKRDDLGRTHLRFQQRHRGLEVWPAELIVHLDSRGSVDCVDGFSIATPADLARVPQLSAAGAERSARQALEGGDAASVSTPELLVYAPGDRPARLAWSVRVEVALTSRWRVLVDAVDGRVLNAYDEVRTQNTAGSGVDLTGATRSLNVWQEGGQFFTVDTSKPMYDPSSDPPDPSTSRGTISILDAENMPPTSNVEQIPPVAFVTSSSPNGPWLPDAVSAAFNFSEVYEYFRVVHGRNSLDDAGGKILAIVRLGQNFNNAFFLHESNLMGFGDAEPFAAALDVVGHELAHGVTHHSANLVYQDQPGALNESFSDVFGEMVEAHVRGSNDWLVGTELSSAFRNMQDPSSIIIGGLGVPYPERMSEFIQTSQDNGGVHLNSSIPNHAFYQLAQGLPGAIGRADAEAIFFRALTMHLTANSQFIDARLAAIQSAEELFGAGSEQALRTAEAFDFVEIFDGSGTPPPSEFPGTEGEDALVFLRFDSDVSRWFLWREELPGDPLGGVPLSAFDVASTRPSVQGDGALAVFVDSVNDVCFIETAGGYEEACLGFAGEISSVAMSPSGDQYGFVFRDPSTGQPENRIEVIDFTLPKGQDVQVFELDSPAVDGSGGIASVLYADAMDFTADGRRLVYDGLNEIQVLGGYVIQAWSIYTLDLQTGAIFASVPPIEGLDIGFPALSQRRDNFVVFDVVDQFYGDSVIYTANLETGELGAVGGNSGGFGAPVFDGDDAAVLFSAVDLDTGYYTDSGLSIVRQPLSPDRLGPAGQPELWVVDADFGVVYRRGEFVPEPAGALQGVAGLLVLYALARRRAARAGTC